MPDLLFERELSTWDGTDWKQLGLKVLTLDNAGVSLAQTFRARDRRLSAADAFALALAKTGPHMLLAGDGAVRDVAGAEGIECHGVLWVLDELRRSHILSPHRSLEALQAICQHPRCRLPASEVKRRMELYRQEANKTGRDNQGDVD